MDKHTPGPWEVEGDSVVNREFEGDEWCICEVYGLSSIADANRSLISAVPDLLEALQSAVADLFYQIESKHGAKIASEYPSIVEGKTAIAKATKSPD